ncbi:MAG: AEC family transporter [Candidatus Lokiarchaeota archaeon]|nr:AEC family transporter [Candidatus Lokiarchaeota archaeon]MBD3341188.1 AEC family transporter [Candidatus Lokiarchaeota archaeon]
MVDVNYVFLLSLSIIVIGFIIKKLNIITESNGKILAKIILNVTLPALILNVVSKLKINLTLIFLPIISLIYSLSIMGIGLIIFKKVSKQYKGLILMTIVGYNIGLFAYPLIQGIWGDIGLEYIAMFDIGNSFVIFGLCYFVGSYFSPAQNDSSKKGNYSYIFKQMAKSIPLNALYIALIINLSGINLPIFVYDLLEIISRANMALVLLLLGIYLNFNFERSQWKYISIALTTRYSLGLVTGIILYYILPFDKFFRNILLISLILPIGMAIIPFSVEFEYDQKLSGSLVNLSIVISFGLMWVLIIFLTMS